VFIEMVAEDARKGGNTACKKYNIVTAYCGKF
jgi:hypothetical protein